MDSTKWLTDALEVYFIGFKKSKEIGISIRDAISYLEFVGSVAI